MKSMSEISDFVDEIIEKHNIDKRIDEIQKIFEKFRKAQLRDYNISIEFAADSTVIVSYFYYFLMEKEIKDYLDDNSNIWKMASGTELTINYVQPVIASSSNKSLRALNAQLASYAGIGFLTGWNNVEYDLNSGVGRLNDSVNSFLNEKLKILENQNIEGGLPILINSQSWELFDLIHQYYRSIPFMN